MYAMYEYIRIRLLLLLLMFQLPFATPSRILLMPFPYKSHVTEMSAIGSELLLNSHNVDMLLPASYPELGRVNTESGFNVVAYSVKERDLYSMSPSEADDDWVDVALNSYPIDEFRTNVDGFLQLCTNPLEDPTLADRLRRLQFDLAVVDAFPGSRCYWILAHWIGVPYVSLTTQYEPWLWRVPALPSFVPFPLAHGAYTERMTFCERLWNAWTLLDWTLWPRVEYIDNSFVEKYLPGQTYWTLAAKSLVWLIDTDTVIDYPRPTMPNEVNVGGLLTGAARPLTGELHKFVEAGVDGLIIVAFGSLDVGSDRFFDEFFTAFSRLSEYHLVWRYAGKIPASSSDDQRVWPKHVLRRDWLPLNDLLGHANTRLLISHCGANSQFEALYHGVPQLCLPVWADQMYNAARLQYRGHGFNLGRMRDVTVDRLVAGARDVINNRSYADNVRAASVVFRSRVQSPRERAAWWIEHVMRHGASHVRSHALDMAWYEYLMVDLLAVCVLIPLILMTSAVTACICCCTRRHAVTMTSHHKQQ